MQPDWENENPDDDPLCAVCARDNRNGTHDALERSGHLSHEFIAWDTVKAMNSFDRSQLRERLLRRGVAIVGGSLLSSEAIRELARKEEEPDPTPLLDIDHFQEVVGEWCQRNFGHQSDLVLYGGTGEEAGELLRGAVKREQGIRGTRAEWDAEIQKEMGDVAIKLASIAAQEGWNLATIIARRWADVSQRVWSGEDKTGHGLPKEDQP